MLISILDHISLGSLDCYTGDVRLLILIINLNSKYKQVFYWTTATVVQKQ